MTDPPMVALMQRQYYHSHTLNIRCMLKSYSYLMKRTCTGYVGQIAYGF